MLQTKTDDAPLLVKERIIRSIPSTHPNSSMSHNLAQPSSPHVTFNDHNPVIVLQRRDDQRPGLIEREASGVESTSRRSLNERHLTSLAVNSKRDQGVRRKRRTVRGIQIRKRERVLAP
jgi:hypothetical protein